MTDAFPPLSIEVKPGFHRTYGSVEEITTILLTWPGGIKRIAAIRACVAALEGTGSALMARECFLEAAEEAGVFTREGEMFPRPKP